MSDILNNINFALASSFINEDAGQWNQLKEVIGKVVPILWIATAIVSTIWLVIKFIQSNFQSATGDQGKYEQAKKARKRAIFAWITGLLWPIIFLIAWPLAKMIFTAINPDAAKDFPDIF